MHYWADLQSVRGLRCRGNVAQTRNVSEYAPVVALCRGAATTAPLICEEADTIDEDGGSEVADVVAVSPDGSETVNASDALSADDWMPLPVDVHGRPFSIHVRPRRHCSRWKFTRLSFDVRGASKFRVRIGEFYVTNWVRATGIRCLRRHTAVYILRES